MTFPSIPHRRHLPSLVAVAVLGLLAACNVVPPAQDDPTRYFVLSDPVSAPVLAPAAGAARIGLRQVKVETFLKKREIIVRKGENEVEFRDFRRWAEPLDSGILRVLRLRLLESPDVAEVFTEPFPTDQEPDYEVTIDVRRCEGSLAPSGRYVASFSATMEISTTGSASHVVARKLFNAPDAAWDGRDFEKLASLLSADIAALGQEVLSGIPVRN
jgi:uncharacterized protein